MYMHRCLLLAALGQGNVAPNPMVGAVLVYGDEIIGEGYHKFFGRPHAEVNCIESVPLTKRHLIQDAILYVSLEPCAHFGKTPPCTNLILEKNIKQVVVACTDDNELVAGKGIAKLRAAGVNVVVGVLEHEAKKLNKRFFRFHALHRPYIVLKWAQSVNGKISGANGVPLKISNRFTDKLVHKWRQAEAAILVGKNTVMKDNPLLTQRHWFGGSPARVIFDRKLQIPSNANVFASTESVYIFNEEKEVIVGNVEYIKLPNVDNDMFLIKAMTGLYERGVQSVLVEGGAETINRFLKSGIWDEASVITAQNLTIAEGIDAPVISDSFFAYKQDIFDDQIEYFTNNN